MFLILEQVYKAIAKSILNAVSPTSTESTSNLHSPNDASQKQVEKLK